MKHLVSVAVFAGFCSFAGFCFSAQAHETMRHPVAPTQNVANSARYEWMTHHSAAFRHRRMVKECGPLRNDEAMYHNCIDGFYKQ